MHFKCYLDNHTTVLYCTVLSPTILPLKHFATEGFLIAEKPRFLHRLFQRNRGILVNFFRGGKKKNFIVIPNFISPTMSFSGPRITVVLKGIARSPFGLPFGIGP